MFVLDNGYNSTDDRPKMITPIWLDEIQNNKIFNKQKQKMLKEV